MASEPDMLATKGEFARLINVSPGRITQMIAEGKIGPDALDGAGRSAKIKVNLARQQIGARTDVGQRFGNGLGTQLNLPTADDTIRATPPLSLTDPTTDLIKRERLRGLQLANERAAEQRLAEQGRYVSAEAAQATMTRMASSLLVAFEGSLPDLAATLAGKINVPARDVLHELRAGFREVRAKLAETARRDAAGLPRLVADEVPDAVDPALGEA